MGGQEMLIELLAGTIAASLAGLALHFSFKLLDPNRAAREAAAARKKDIARRLGRPNIVTNQYEDIIACDVANPLEITTTFDQIGGLGETKRALQELVILPLLRPELFASGNLLRPVKGCMLCEQTGDRVYGRPNGHAANGRAGRWARGRAGTGDRVGGRTSEQSRGVWDARTS